MIVKHKVADFANWKKVFDSMHDIRFSYGWTGHEVLRDANDPQTVIIVNHAKTLDGIKAYGTSSELKEGMQNAGVLTAPEITFLNDEETLSY